MAMEPGADTLLAHIKMVRDDLDAGRLTPRQVQLCRQLGREVERITRAMDDTTNTHAAEALWIQGAALILTFLDKHFPTSTCH